MLALTHYSARDLLNAGSAELTAAERTALTAHLDQCAECRTYATELSELRTAVTRLFRARWQAMPSQQAMDTAVTRLKQRQARKRTAQRANALAFAVGLVALTMALVWLLNPPAVPSEPQTAAAPAALSTTPPPETVPTLVPEAAIFDGNITLVDAALEKTRWMAGSTISLTMRWRAQSDLRSTYTSFVQLLDSAGSVVAQSDSISGVARPPLDQPPDEIGETLYLVLPDDLAGRYELVAGLYDVTTGARLQINGGQSYVSLGTIEIQPIPQRINENLGSFATLLGMDELPDSVVAGETISLTLYWRSLAATSSSYRVSLQVFGDNKSLVAQIDSVPGNGAQPTNTWQPGEVIVDPYALNLPADLPPGSYRLLVLMFDSASGAQIFTGSGNGSVTLGTLSIVPATNGTPFPTSTPWLAETPPPGSASQGTVTPIPTLPSRMHTPIPRTSPIPTSTPWVTRTPFPAVTLTPSSQPIDLSACLVTVPNGSTPPGEAYSPEYHGNGELWTVLWPNGNTVIGPQDIMTDGSLSAKSLWWRGVKGQLTIEGRRLNADAAPLRADTPDGYGDSGVQASALIFPTEGCWEVTGRVGDAALTFVTRVIKGSQ